jgi:hypothetical protein
MAMATLIYDSCIDDTVRGAIDWDADTFKAMIVTDTYTPNKGSHTRRSDVTNEVTGTGYTAGGLAVTATVTKDTTNHRVDITFSDPSWTTATITGRGIVVYKSRGGASSADELLFAITNGSDVSSTAGTWSFDINAPLRFQN